MYIRANGKGKYGCHTYYTIISKGLASDFYVQSATKSVEKVNVGLPKRGVAEGDFVMHYESIRDFTFQNKKTR